MGPRMTKATFDGYSNNYDEALEQGLSVSGEDSIYFVKGRLNWLKSVLPRYGCEPASVIDFGCGVGNSLPYLRDILGATRVAGIDVSAESIRTAETRYPRDGFQLATCDNLEPKADFDLAFCNGVFHHIPLTERDNSAQLIKRHLRPGGLFAFFENNPLNPGTRYVMSRIPFDREAVTLTPWNARQLLRRAGFRILCTHYLFYFPKALAALRFCEPWLSRVPFGAQYLVLCEAPKDAK